MLLVEAWDHQTDDRGAVSRLERSGRSGRGARWARVRAVTDGPWIA